MTFPAHIVCLQETHWVHESEYLTDTWMVIGSSTGTSTGGVMFLLRRTAVSPELVKYSEIIPGRVLQLRICTEPPLDVLGVYQHAWSLASSATAEDRSQRRQALIQRRASVWHQIKCWAASIPKRNSLLMLGDLNVSVRQLHPHVGPGIASHKALRPPDQEALMDILQNQGLVVLNSWGKQGSQACTFLQHQQGGSQIDFMISRLACPLATCRSTTLRTALVVHPTGLRHIPLCARISLPQRPSTRRPTHPLHAAAVDRVLRRDDAQPDRFKQMVQRQLAQQAQQGDLPDLEGMLRTAWHSTVQAACSRPDHRTSLDSRSQISLRSFWESKRTFRALLHQVHAFRAPVILHVCTAAGGTVARHFPRAFRRLRSVMQCWAAAVRFSVQNKALRQRCTARKKQQVDDLIEAANLSASHGMLNLHKLSQRLAPRSPKRSIHFRNEQGALMSPQEELSSLRSYFKTLYCSDTLSWQEYYLSRPLNITTAEVSAALSATSGRKALPPGHVPAVLWKLAGPDIAVAVAQSFNAYLGVGRLQLPETWNHTYLVLIAKAGKPPNKPANLRPINLLPMMPKLLARIAAVRLQPFVNAALRLTPQFAYVAARQTSDSLDRVLSHCMRVREKLKQYSGLDKRRRVRGGALVGGMQLSLDLAKAYDRMPRHLLASCMQRVGAPEELVTLVLYIHDHAKVLLSRQDLWEEISLGRGVRQGCGLSPLLWISFTLLIFDKFDQYIPKDSQTGYADDFHLQWEFQSPREFRNACSVIPRVISDLRAVGMEVSVDKTVILLALQGASAAQLLGDYTATRRGKRVLCLTHPAGNLELPICKFHTYLGVRIGYTTFERATLRHRSSLAWTAFHRLHGLLKNPRIPTYRRVQLWQSNVWSILVYGLPAVGVDRRSAQSLVSLTMRQLRMVSRSPAHRTHESNQDLLARLQVEHPLARLLQLCQNRVHNSRLSVGHIQPTVVHQWWSVLLSNLQQHLTPDLSYGQGNLTEVTQVLRMRCSCPHCGQYFDSAHAVRVHIGRSHKDKAPKKERNPTIKNIRRDDFRVHAYDGQPQCRHCFKRFYGWPQFMGHFSQAACPVLHHPSDTPHLPQPNPVIETHPETADTATLHHDNAPSSAHGAFAPGGGAAAASSTARADKPSFSKAELQDMAKAGDLKALAAALRADSHTLHCPECHQKVTKPSYLSRHAVKMHPQIRAHQDAVLSWAQSQHSLQRPCQWCGADYTRSSAHLKACPVLWLSGHFLAKFSTLKHPGQRSLLDHGFAPGGHGSFGSKPAGGSQSGAGRLRALDGDTQAAATVPGGGLHTSTFDGPQRDCPANRLAGDGVRQGQAPSSSGSRGGLQRQAEVGQGEDRHSGKGHAAQADAQPLQAASPAQGHGYNDRAQGGQRGHNASKNSGQRQQYRQWPRREDNRREDNRDRQWERSGRKDELKEIVGAIGRLVLRLEDTQAVTN